MLEGFGDGEGDGDRKGDCSGWDPHGCSGVVGVGSGVAGVEKRWRDVDVEVAGVVGGSAIGCGSPREGTGAEEGGVEFPQAGRGVGEGRGKGGNAATSASPLPSSSGSAVGPGVNRLAVVGRQPWAGVDGLVQGVGLMRRVLCALLAGSKERVPCEEAVAAFAWRPWGVGVWTPAPLGGAASPKGVQLLMLAGGRG